MEFFCLFKLSQGRNSPFHCQMSNYLKTSRSTKLKIVQKKTEVRNWIWVSYERVLLRTGFIQGNSCKLYVMQILGNFCLLQAVYQVDGRSVGQFFKGFLVERRNGSLLKDLNREKKIKTSCNRRKEWQGINPGVY